jgi:hypothetical protein
LALIIDFDAPNNNQPEKVLLDFARKLAEQERAPGWLIDDLDWINDQYPRIDGKDAIYALHQHKNMTMERIEAMLIQEVSRLDEWSLYIAPVINRLNDIAKAIGLPPLKKAAA